jgi:ribosome maturation factor RimP
MDLIDRISGIAQRACEAHGIDLVDIESFRAGRRRMVRIYIGKAEGVSVDDCANVSRQLSTLLDVENVLENEAYTLEVSSPGIDRPFKTLRDWQRNVGRPVRVSTKQPIEGKNIITGRLIEADDQKAVLETPSGRLEVPQAQVAQARCEIEMPS